jgi:hypothetical protein
MKQRAIAILKANGRTLLLLLALTLFLTLAFCIAREKTRPCPSSTADPQGYLAAICQHIRDNDVNVSPADPTRYGIIRTEMSEQNGRSVILVFLNCCYLGDVAILDAETGEVIDFRVGAK